MSALMDESLKTVTIVSFGMDLEQATYAETADGTPYVLIPTETVIDLGEQGKIRASSQTLGLLDEGEWYLVRIEDAATMAALKAIYPVLRRRRIHARHDGASHRMISASLAALLYLVSGVLFILALRGLSHPVVGAPGQHLRHGGHGDRHRSRRSRSAASATGCRGS